MRRLRQPSHTCIIEASRLISYTHQPERRKIMSEYTSTIEGFQKAMQWSLSGPPEGTKEYVEATTLPTFYHTMNGQKLEMDVYIKGIEEWRSKVSEYKPKV
jgi:hypothetical protein